MSTHDELTASEIEELKTSRFWTLLEASGVLSGVRPPPTVGSSNNPEHLIDAAFEDSDTRRNLKRYYRALKDAIRDGDERIDLQTDISAEERRAPGRHTRVRPASIVRWAIGEKLDKHMPAQFRELTKVRTPTRRAEYSTKFLRAAEAVIAEFWRHRKHGQEPTQGAVERWLTDNYSRASDEKISASEATSVDRVCRPDDLRDKGRIVRSKPRTR